jgi:hypothetical protein
MYQILICFLSKVFLNDIQNILQKSRGISVNTIKLNDSTKKKIQHSIYEKSQKLNFE